MWTVGETRGKFSTRPESHRVFATVETMQDYPRTDKEDSTVAPNRVAGRHIASLLEDQADLLMPCRCGYLSPSADLDGFSAHLVMTCNGQSY